MSTEDCSGDGQAPCCQAALDRCCQTSSPPRPGRSRSHSPTSSLAATFFSYNKTGLQIETSTSASTDQLMLPATRTLKHSIGALSQVQGKSRSLVESLGCLCGIPACQGRPSNDMPVAFLFATSLLCTDASNDWRQSWARQYRGMQFGVWLIFFLRVFRQ